MGRILYLLGAGASAKAMPVNDKMETRIRDQYDLLGGIKSVMGSTDADAKNMGEYLSDLHFIWEGARDHASIDTFAKKLFLKGQTEQLKILKCALSTFLALEHIRKKIPDPRYDSFFASIIERSYMNLPTDFTILTWNYDQQIEASYSEFADESIEGSKTILNCISKYTNSAFSAVDDKFSVIKLNGDISVRIKGSNNYKHLINPEKKDGFDKDVYISVLRIWREMRSDEIFESNISFAWEDDANAKHRILEIAKPAVEDAEIIIIIGYSFPLFNRAVDRELFNMIQNPQEIYIQSETIESAKGLCDRFWKMLAIDAGFEPQPIVDDKQFFIPLEY